jgi:enterochelin esterase-like enzyme
MIHSSYRRGAPRAASLVLTLAAAMTVVPPALAQEPARPAPAAAQPGRPPSPPPFSSTEVAPDGRITFKLFAPQAQVVRLSASDIPGAMGPASQATKGDAGVWTVTVGPVEPGAYRYTFSVDGVSTVDPRNPAVSESNNNVSSLVLVPGADLFDTKEVPHGAVAAVTYKSSALGRFRRMHVYTPPGYESGKGKYPVFYLLHGAGDNDHSWSTVGRAGFILDNLIAAGRAKPMVVVMPAGHTSRSMAGAMGRSANDEFVNDFVKDVMPYVESHYRVLTDRANTAIAGLSMGGSQTLAVAIPRLGRFGYVGVFSSGLIGAFPTLAGRGMPAPPAAPGAAGARPDGPPTAAEWETLNAAQIDNAALKAGLKLLWFGTGKDDFLLTTTQATVDLLKKHGFAPVFKQTDGGHTWINWRHYLAEFAPLLFR